jgi:hypothetical protein
MKIVIISVLALGACVDTASSVSDTSQLTEIEDYTWMLGTWVCNGASNSYLIAPPFKRHQITAAYNFTLVEAHSDTLVVHESYTEQSVNPAFLTNNFEADLEIDLSVLPDADGHLARVSGVFADGGVFDGAGKVAARSPSTSVNFGRWNFVGHITPTIDKLTHSWSLTSFASDARPGSLFGNFTSNYRLQFGDSPDNQLVYLATDCSLDEQHVPPI